MTAKAHRKRAEALMQFCTKVAIPEVDAKKPEPPFSYNLNVPVPVGQLKVASESDYTLLKDVFGKAITLLEVSLGHRIYIRVENGVDERDLAQGIADINGLPDATELTLKITIAKAILIEQMELDRTHYNCLFYLFEQNLEDFLAAPLLQLDKALFEKRGGAAVAADSSAVDKPTVIVVSDADIYFAGDMLTIIGESGIGSTGSLRGRSAGADKHLASIAPQGAKWKAARAIADLLSRLALYPWQRRARSSLASAPNEEQNSLTAIQEQIGNYRTVARENPSLIGQQFRCLTPLHFVGCWREKDSGRLETILSRQFADICILYTANRSTFNDKGGPLESVYNSSDRTATLSLETERTVSIPTSALESLARWLHSRKGTDQRNVFQLVVARQLYDDDKSANYNNFIDRLPHLLAEARWQYQVFVDGRITKHFEEMQKVVGYVSDVNKKISEAIDSVTKSLTDALLATVGVLVLTVLAALVKKDTSIQIFGISMQVYSAYLFFYALYRMGSILHSYWLLSADTDTQLIEFRRALGENKVNDLSAPLVRRRRQFHFWFWLTVLLYLVLAGSIRWAGKKGPQFLIDRGIITAPGIKPLEASSSVFGGVFSEQRTTG